MVSNLFLRTQIIDTLSESEAKEELAALAVDINHHDQLYYEKNHPSISDATYDELRLRNKKIEKKFPQLIHKDSPSFRVGSKSSKGFRKIKHVSPMLSLDNAFSIEDMADFYLRIRRFLNLKTDTCIELIAEPKIDGLSASLHYKDGKLEKAITRGDGAEGEDITANIKTINSIPPTLKSFTLPKNIEVRGEVYMSHKDFEELNQQRKINKESLFSNPRNAASGSLRQLDFNITKERKLHFFAYALIDNDKLALDTYDKQKNWIKQAGFTSLPESEHIRSLEELEAYYQSLEIRRSNLPFDIDGVVYKVNNLSWQKRLGSSARSPRWAIAQKFPAEKAITILKDIKVQVGRTGVLTPVASLHPITVGGVVVKRATLHNEDELRRKDIRIGDTIIIQRAGDVIPQVVEVLKEYRPKNTVAFNFPKSCPECNSHIVREDGYAAWYCTGGLICPAQIVEHLKHFVSRDAFNIEGLGRKHIEVFFKKGILKSPQDIFTLEKKDRIGSSKIQDKEGWGELSALNLFSAIDKARTVILSRFLFSLGIPMIGKITAKSLAQYFQSYTNLKKFMLQLIQKDTAARKEILSLNGIGQIALDNLINFMEEPHNQDILLALENELTVQNEPQIKASTHQFLTGKKVIFTGALKNMTRAEAKQLAETLGAKVQSSLSVKTDYLIVGDTPGSKRKKALELGIPIITEQEWLQLSKWHR